MFLQCSSLKRGLGESSYDTRFGYIAELYSTVRLASWSDRRVTYSLMYNTRCRNNSVYRRAYIEMERVGCELIMNILAGGRNTKRNETSRLCKSFEWRSPRSDLLLPSCPTHIRPFRKTTPVASSFTLPPCL